MQIFLQKLRRRRPLHLWPSAVLQCCSVDTWLQYRHRQAVLQTPVTTYSGAALSSRGCWVFWRFSWPALTGDSGPWPLAPVNDWQPQNKAWMGVWGSTYKISNVNINNQMVGLEVCKELSPGVKECRDSVSSGKYTRPHSGSWAASSLHKTMDPMPEPRCSSVLTGLSAARRSGGSVR